MRLSNELLQLIDLECSKRVGCVSRNTWIAEAISEKLARCLASQVETDKNDRAA